MMMRLLVYLKKFISKTNKIVFIVIVLKNKKAI